MKIAILNTLYFPYKVGGAEVSVQLLAESLSEAGHEVSVIALSDGKKCEKEIVNNVAVYRLPIRNIYWPFSSVQQGVIKKTIWHMVDFYNFAARKDVYLLLKEIRPDVLHTNNISGFSVSVWDAAASLDIPIVHTSRDYYLIHPNGKLYTKSGPQNPKSAGVRLVSFLKKKKSQKIDMYISISDYVKDLHLGLGYFKPSRNSTIYNSIVLPALPPSNKAPRDRITLGYIGRIDRFKGVEEVLESLEVLDEKYTFVIAGTGPEAYTSKLKSKKSKHDICWLGHTNPEDFFPQIDVLLVPSLWAEPLGRVVLEAYSYGIPVIASNVGGIPEIVKHGVTGYCYSDNSTYNLAKAIDEVRNIIGESNRQSCLDFAKQFSQESIKRSYLKAFMSVERR